MSVLEPGFQITFERGPRTESTLAQAPILKRASSNPNPSFKLPNSSRLTSLLQPAIGTSFYRSPSIPTLALLLTPSRHATYPSPPHGTELPQLVARPSPSPCPELDGSGLGDSPRESLPNLTDPSPYFASTSTPGAGPCNGIGQKGLSSSNWRRRFRGPLFIWAT
jgi:hypothetical protein